jgi:uncharacterized protein (DUF433 family)
MSDEIATEHPHIVRRPGVIGGSPAIRGTRIGVRNIAFLWNDGETVAGILEYYPHLQASWVYDAISYYLDHRAEIDEEIRENQYPDPGGDGGDATSAAAGRRETGDHGR